MIENGMRLNISVDGNNFTIVDQLSEGMLVYKNGSYIADSLDHTTVIEGLNGLIDQLMGAKLKLKLLKYASEIDSGLIITQREHNVFHVETEVARGEYDTGVLRCGWGFNVSTIVSKISYVIETLCKTGSNILDLKTSVVRRYVDADLVVARGNGHEIVVRKCNVYDNVLRNVLYDKEMLPFLYVDIHAKEGSVHFFDNSLNLMCTMQYDESFDVYFTSDVNSFDCEG